MEGMRRIAPAAAAILAGCMVSAWSQEQGSTAPPPASFPSYPAGPPAAPAWRLMVSPYTLHFSHDPAHKEVYMVGLEHERPSGVVWGAAVFDNSFGQPSVFAFGGQR